MRRPQFLWSSHFNKSTTVHSINPFCGVLIKICFINSISVSLPQYDNTCLVATASTDFFFSIKFFSENIMYPAIYRVISSLSWLREYDSSGAFTAYFCFANFFGGNHQISFHITDHLLFVYTHFLTKFFRTDFLTKILPILFSECVQALLEE